MNITEILLCTFLAFLLVIVLWVLDMAGTFRRRRLKEPPLDKGLIPWLGHAFPFRKNPVAFLERMQKKHGDIFTVLVGGNYLHFVLDPHTYRTVIKESKDKLDFFNFGSMIVFNAFGILHTESHHKMVQTLSKKYLRGKSLAVLNQVMMEKLQAVLLPSWDWIKKERPWQQDGVFHFSHKTIFQASFMALFGTEPDQDKENAMERKITQWEVLFEKFQKFDHLFPALAFGTLDHVGKKEVESVRTFFWDVLSVEKMYHKDNISSWAAEQDQRMAEMGMTEKMRTQFQFLLLWASQTNTGPATFWILVHLLKNPEAMEAVKEELDRVLKDAGQDMNPGSPFIQQSLQKIKTPLLDSAIQEILRLSASSFLYRGVMQDMNLRAADGNEYVFRKGDNILLVPFAGLHMNPEFFCDPHTFKYDRFVKPEGNKEEFNKNEKRLKYPIMPWGAGPNMCPGRFFAVSELKFFVIMMLRYFEMELVNQDEDVPPVDTTRYGFGVVPPAHDIQFRYRLKL